MICDYGIEPVRNEEINEEAVELLPNPQMAFCQS